MAGRRTGGSAPFFKEGLLPLLPWLLALCGGTVAKECRVRPETSLKAPGWCLSDVDSATGELLNNVNQLRTSNNAQLPQAAIPLPPSYSVPKLKADPPRGRARGAGVAEELKTLDKGVRGLEKVRMEDVYEGSFNFAHPGYRWVDEVRASVPFYGEGLEPEVSEWRGPSGVPLLREKKPLGPKVTEEEEEEGEEEEEEDKLIPIGWGRVGNRGYLITGEFLDTRPANSNATRADRWRAGWARPCLLGTVLESLGRKSAIRKFQSGEQAGPPSHRLDWTLYSGIMLCGPFFFGLLVYGLYVRFVRRTSTSSSLDAGQELESDDDEIPPMEMRRSMANWRMLWRAILVSTESGGDEFSGGMSIEDIEKLPLVAHCEEDQCLSGTKFRCIICLSDVKKGEILREIPCCGHRFHSNCVDPWLERSATCPLCRRDVIVKQEGGDGAIQEDDPVDVTSTVDALDIDTEHVPDSPTLSSFFQLTTSDEHQDIATLPDPATPTSSQGQDGEEPPLRDNLPSAMAAEDAPGTGGDSNVPMSSAAVSSDVDDWREPEPPGGAAGVEVDGWEIIDGGS